MHVILCQATEFRPNRSTHCGNMTSYPFLKMAAATAKYYFRLRICWCHCLQNVKLYQQSKFRLDISIGGWYITTSTFEIQTSAIFEFDFRFRFRPFPVIGVSFWTRMPNFVHIGTSAAEIWCRHIDSRWRPSAMLYLLWGNGGPLPFNVNIQRPITRVTVSRVWSVQWFRFQWPWVTLNVDFMITEMPSTNCVRSWRAICLR